MSDWTVARTAAFATSSTSYTTVTTLLGSSLAANTDYMLLVYGAVAGSTSTPRFFVRTTTGDDAAIAADSEMEAYNTWPTNTEGDHGVPYGYLTKFRTGGSPSDILFQVQSPTAFPLDVFEAVIAVLEWPNPIDNIAAVTPYDLFGGTLGAVEPDQALAQSFTVPANHELEQVRVWVEAVGTPGDSLTATIRTGSQTGTVVATANAAQAPASGADWVLFDGWNVTLSSGTTYYLVIERSGSRDILNYYRLYSSGATNEYANGTLSARNNNAWSDESGHDLTFTIGPAIFKEDRAGTGLEYTPGGTMTESQTVDPVGIKDGRYVIFAGFKTQHGRDSRHYGGAILGWPGSDPGSPDYIANIQPTPRISNTRSANLLWGVHYKPEGDRRIALYHSQEGTTGDHRDDGTCFIAIHESAFGGIAFTHGGSSTLAAGVDTTLAYLQVLAPATDDYMVLGNSREANPRRGLSYVWVDRSGTPLETYNVVAMGDDRASIEHWDNPSGLSLQAFTAGDNELLRLRGRRDSGAHSFTYRQIIALGLDKVECSMQAPQGDWVGAFGVDGYWLAAWNNPNHLFSSSVANPVIVDQGTSTSWAAPTADVRALESPDELERRARVVYHASEIRLRVPFTSNYQGTFHIYCLDWDANNRRQLIEVIDDIGASYCQLTTDFSQGSWSSFNIDIAAGNDLVVNIANQGPANAVVSGMFIGTVASLAVADSDSLSLVESGSVNILYQELNDVDGLTVTDDASLSNTELIFDSDNIVLTDAQITRLYDTDNIGIVSEAIVFFDAGDPNCVPQFSGEEFATAEAGIEEVGAEGGVVTTTCAHFVLEVTADINLNAAAKILCPPVMGGRVKAGSTIVKVGCVDTSTDTSLKEPDCD